MSTDNTLEIVKEYSDIVTKVISEKDKGIYGTASKQDIKELKEEGIDTDIIPWIEDKNS